jgi:DNA-binding response OmpR family regulator/class 3 adenylate cyclase/predicted ATPase
MRKRVLVLAQEMAHRAKIACTLQSAGYTVELAENEKRAFELIGSGKIDAAIVALGPGLVGTAVARELGDIIPRMIVLTERAEDIVRLGHSLPWAHAQVLHPLNKQQLLARLAQVMASPAGAGGEAAPAPATLCIEGSRLDLPGRTFVHADGREVPLTRTECSLLATLISSPGRVLSRDRLSHVVTRRGTEPYERSIDMHVARLRRKIEPEPKAPRFIVTVPGIGYKFAARPETVEENRRSPWANELEMRTEAEPTWFNRLRPADTVPERALLPHSGSERRQVTVLSCDLADLTELVRNLDPEELAHIVHGFQDACTAVIANMGGSIPALTGHEILALFGYPQAHEDAAARAVHAGLHLVAKTVLSPSGKPLQVRVGIATGLVVIADQGAVGEPLTVAVGLRNKAPPSSVIVAATTRRLIGGEFICDEPSLCELPEISVKVDVCGVKGARIVESRFNSMRGAALTQFVGRQHELRQLLAAWERAKAGKGQVVLLGGEAGIGKSRLCETFLNRIAEEPHITIRYQCSPHHINSPFWPIINQLERAAGFEVADPPDIKLKKLEDMLSRSGAATLADIRSYAALLSIPTGERPVPGSTAQRKKDLTIKAVVQQNVNLSRMLPVVIVLADAHWIDSSTIELLNRMIASIKTARCIVVISFRPELFPPWLDESHVTMLRLARLGREQINAIMFDVAGRKTLPPEIHAQIVSKTDGIPLFVEELTKMILEGGGLQVADDRYVTVGPLPPLAVPMTLLDSLTARLDRLGPAKEIAQIAAAIGRDFSYRLIAAVAPVSGPQLHAALTQLSASKLIVARGDPPDSTYVFKHALVQDAAYATLIRSKRQQLHSRIANALEEGFPESVENQPELIAHHLARAGLTERAIDYLRKAGQRTIERSANVEAIGHLTCALELLQSHPEYPQRTRTTLELEVLLSQAMIASHGYAAPETIQVLLRARAHIDDWTDTSQKLAILYGIWASYYVGGKITNQVEAARELFAEAKRHNDTAALCVAHRIMGTTCVTKGEFAAGLSHLQRARTLYHSVHDVGLQSQYGQDIGAAALCYLSWTLWQLGYFDQASQVAADAMKRAEELSHPHTLVYTICHAGGMLDIFRRRSENMQSYARSVISLCNEHGLRHWVGCGRVLEGWGAICQGNVDQGNEVLRTGVTAWEKAGARLWLPIFLALKAEAYAKRTCSDAALRAIEQAIAISEQSGECLYIAELLRIKAGLLLAAVDRAGDQIESLLVSSLEIARRQQARCWELRTACDLAQLLQGKGRRKEALQLLQPIYDQFTEGFDTSDLQYAKLIIDSLKAKRGRVPHVNRIVKDRAFLGSGRKCLSEQSPLINANWNSGGQDAVTSDTSWSRTADR